MTLTRPACRRSDIKLQNLIFVTSAPSVQRVEQRTLGADVCVGAVGLGCAGMSGAYGHSADEQSVATLRYAPALLALLDSERTGSKH